MSARSAFARRKTTQSKSKDNAKHSRAQSSSSREDLFTNTSIPPTGATTSTPRYPIQTPRHAATPAGSRGDWATRGKSTTREDWNTDLYMDSTQFTSPTEDWVYNRSRRATLPEESSTIEKSGLRSIIDKRSDEVRKGIAKTFTFRKKEKEDDVIDQDSTESRPSAETIQPNIIPNPHESRGWDAQSLAQTETTLVSTASYTPSQYLVPSPPSSHLSWSILPAGPPPTAKLPPIPQTPPVAAPPMKRWSGGGRPVAKWNKLRKDPELWDPSGDVLIYLGRKGQNLPTMRLSSQLIEATKSRHLLSLLHEGSLEEYLHSPPSPTGELYGMKRGQEFLSAPLTPPASQRTSMGDMEGQILYEMHFPPPQNTKSFDQLRHQITTRNFFAVLLNASIVGFSLHEALSDLHIRLDSCMPPNNDNVKQIVRYIRKRGLDDVRNSPYTAVSLLAWAEEPDVRWEDGWRECFTHCVGMYDRVQKYKDFNRITPNTRNLLERASMEMQGRLQAAEERLASFEYRDMWMFAQENSPKGTAAERLRRMFVQHLERNYGSWPPSMPAQPDGRSSRLANSTRPDAWLSRSLVMKLQRDFGALYDHIVDRDIVWGTTKAQSGRKLTMVSMTGIGVFGADMNEVPLMDMFIEFDNKQHFPHIPHPYPSLPESTLRSSAAGGLIREGNARTESDRMGALHERIRLAYTKSTDVDTQESEEFPNELVDEFIRFEEADDIGGMNPATARCSRWVLIYGILQTLASVSVDDERVQHGDKVDYHLNPRLEGVRVPPWKRDMSEGIGERAHERSYCWIAEAGGKAEQDEYVDDVDMNLINDLPLQLDTTRATGDMSPALSGPLGAGFSGRVKERIRRERQNESPITNDYLCT
ncbi:hypothetical protein FSARC_1231 [Fusarium sarcochroum]|uniref:DUF8004 domain-containing protein n=1 Tax=Fusarium sarcochroum TaxID=1208366 RepID=A0A8H4U961_9HYPO|nr:hypothetical protein FSARC_1231 [Fusarium sarcochroum]